MKETEIPVEEYLTYLKLDVASHVRAAEAFACRAIDKNGVELSIGLQNMPQRRPKVEEPIKYGRSPADFKNKDDLYPWQEDLTRMLRNKHQDHSTTPKVGEIWSYHKMPVFVYKIREDDTVDIAYISFTDAHILERNTDLMHLKFKLNKTEGVDHFLKMVGISWLENTEEFKAAAYAFKS